MPTETESVEYTTLASAIVCIRDFGVVTHTDCSAVILAAAEKYLEILKTREQDPEGDYLRAYDLYQITASLPGNSIVYVHINFDFPLLKPKGPQVDNGNLVLYPHLGILG